MITAKFIGGVQYCIVCGLFQWDVGQFLEISGLDLKEGTEVHFSNSTMQNSIRKPVLEGGIVEIPDELLEQSHDITAWIYEDNETIKEMFLPVEKRKKPDGFVSSVEYKHSANLLKTATKLSWANVKGMPSYIILERDAEDWNRTFYGADGIEDIVMIAPSLSDASYMFRDVSTLKSVTFNHDLKPKNTSYMFSGCTNLKVIKGMFDLSSVTSTANMFNNTTSLECFEIVPETLGTNLNIGFSNDLTLECLESLIHGLKDLTGKPSKTLTINSVNIAKLTDELKAEATNKNWVLA